MSTRRTPERLSNQERADRFAEYFQGVVSMLKAERGMTASQIINLAVPRTTFYRWLAADLADGMPKAARVRDAFEKLDLDPEEALRVLGYSSAHAAPLPVDAVHVDDPQLREYLRTILRRVEDPSTPESEDYYIRATLAALAGRSAPATSSPSEKQHRRNRRTG